MFVLEESQLLEDRIKDAGVLKLYKILRENETSNNRELFIEGILKSEQCQLLTRLLVDNYHSNGLDLKNSVCDDVRFTLEQRENICSQLNLENTELAPLALVVSAALTQLFVIDNFVGPTNDESTAKSYRGLPEIYETVQSRADYRSLSRDGSDVYHLTTNPWLLRTVQLYWLFLSSLGCSRRLLELEFLVWKHRFMTIHLMILLEQPESLVSELRKIQEHIFDHHIVNAEIKENNTQLTRFNIVELCCELAQSALLRDGITFCRKFADFASDTSKISIEHTGVLGKRTKFQQNNIPQLVVKIAKSTNGEAPEYIFEEPDSSNLPKDITLDDDTLLPDISFVKQEEDASQTENIEKLSVDAQLMLQTRLDIALRSEVMEESLKDEWTLAYLRSIIKSTTLWCIKYKSLGLRSVTEKKHMRKMDRALMQMEELIKASETASDLAHKRLRSFYSVLPPSRWQMQRSLGDISFDISLCKNALDIYLKIEYWEGIIRCYSTLGQTVKAEQVIHQELAKQETPYLYCLLGDATDNLEYYEKSWQLSNGRFARAKKSIGTYCYVRKQYPEAIDNYEQAHKANPSNVSILSLLAYSCLTIERYERAAECYRNLTYLDDSNFLAWNNLSKAYIKLDQKERAWRTLREAIKCNFEEWKVWENFMLVSIQIGALDDVITAWHRLIDIKSSHEDDQILNALTFSILKRHFSTENADNMKLLDEALKLVARLSSTSKCSPRVWICKCKLLIKEFECFKLRSEGQDDGKPSQLDVNSRVSKITGALQRATPTALTIDTEWSRVPEKVDQVLDSFDELADCYMDAVETLGPRPELGRQWKNFKLSVNTTMKLLEKKGYTAMRGH